MSVMESDQATVDFPSRIPLTDDQREIWLASQLGPDASACYHLSYVIHIAGGLDQSILESALQDLVDRHDALRLNVAKDGNSQAIAPRRRQLLEVVTVDERSSDSDLEKLLARRICEPFDLEREPLFRSILFSRGDDHRTLLLVTHHIATDGWSFGVLIHELRTLYAEREKGMPPSFRPAMQFRDYVSWLNSDGHRASETTAKDYWLDLFAEAPPYVEFPADHTRPAVKTYTAGHHRERFEGEFLARLREAGQQQEATLFQLMLASLVALLSRMTGQSDIVVGVPQAGQVSSDLGLFDGAEGLVGHCASLLPIRIRQVTRKSFQDLLSDVKRRLLEAYGHQDYTFSKIAKDLDLPAEPSRLPLVSVSLNLLRVGNGTLGSLETRQTFPPKQFNLFDLTIDLEQGTQFLCLDTKFNSALYEIRSVRRWLSHWKRILEQVIECPTTPIQRLDLLSDRERDLMLNHWNATEHQVDSNVVLHSLFEQSVDRGPERRALVFGECCLTFLELEQRSNRIAHKLQEMGAGPGRLVGVCLDRSPEMVATLLAVLKAGAAYVPLDPVERIAFVLEDAATEVVVTNDSVLEQLGDVGCQVLNLDLDAQAIEAQPHTRPASQVDAEDLAYVIYTSGSTGRPKGVQIEHRAVVNFLRAMAERPGLGPGDVLLAVTTVSFDIAVLEFFLPMSVGASVVLASAQTTRDPDALRHAMTQFGVTAMQATPVTWSMLIESGWTGSSTLKVLCGGEALSSQLAAELLLRCSELWNMYGPTETTVWSTCHRIEDSADVHVGRPISNTQVYILDKALQPQLVGVPGELMIGGMGLARGYLGKPGLTAAAFVANPFRDGQRIYRTGDLARFRDDGNVEYLGRADLQVKIRGFRVELGEIESVLAVQEGIEQAVAVAREDTPGDKQIVAYVRTTNGTTIDETALRNVAKTTLPDYMIPTRIVALETFPVTPNGKVDRRALPRPDDRAVAGTPEEERPQGEIEVGLEALLKKLLRVGKVGRHDHLLDIGGHSLLAVRYFNDIQRIHGIGLPVSALLRAGSIAQLALEIEKHKHSHHEAGCLVPIQVEGTKGGLFVSTGLAATSSSTGIYRNSWVTIFRSTGCSHADWTGSRNHTARSRIWPRHTWRASGPCKRRVPIAWAAIVSAVSSPTK